MISVHAEILVQIYLCYCTIEHLEVHGLLHNYDKTSILVYAFTVHYKFRAVGMSGLHDCRRSRAHASITSGSACV